MVLTHNFTIPPIYRFATSPSFGDKSVEVLLRAKRRKIFRIVCASAVVLTISAIALALFVGFIAAGACALIASASIGWIILAKVSKWPLKVLPKRSMPPPSTPLGQYMPTDVLVSNDVADTFAWKKKLIASAQQSIELSANYAGGESFRQVLQLMEERLKEVPGLKIHMILSSELLEKRDKKMLNKLQDQYPERFEFIITSMTIQSTPRFYSRENHVKLLVIDGQYFVGGGSSIHDKMTRQEVGPNENSTGEALAAKFLHKAFRDTDIVGSGSLASTLRHHFFCLYRGWEKRLTRRKRWRFFPLAEKKKGCCKAFDGSLNVIRNVPATCLVSNAEHGRGNAITKAIAQGILQAKGEVHLASPHFNPVKAIRKALAQRPDLSVTGYFNGGGLYCPASRRSYPLLRRVYEYCPDREYHKKVHLFDGVFSLVGSYNLGIKSHFDDEIAFAFYSPKVHAALLQGLREDQPKARCYSSGEISAVAAKSRFWGAICSWLLGPHFG